MYRVRLVSRGWKGPEGLNTFYFIAEGGEGTETVAEAQSCTERVHSALQTNTTGIFPGAWRAQISGAVDVINPADGKLTMALAPPTPAENGGNAPGTFTAAAAGASVGLLTAGIVRGSRVRGRIFLSPISASSVDPDGSLTTDAITAAAGFGTQLQAGGVGPNFCVWSRPRPANILGDIALPGSAHPVTGVIVRDRCSVLTSRRG